MLQAGEDYPSHGIDDPAEMISEPQKRRSVSGPYERSQAFVSCKEVTAGKHPRR